MSEANRISRIQSFFWQEKKNSPSLIYYFKKLNFVKIKQLKKINKKLKKEIFYLNTKWIIRNTKRYLNKKRKFEKSILHEKKIDKIKYFKFFFFSKLSYSYLKTLYFLPSQYFIKLKSIKKILLNYNFIIRKGKKIFIFNLFHKFLQLLKYYYKVDIFLFLQYIINNLMPSIYFYIKYSSGRKYKIPCLISKKKSYGIALRWLFFSIKNRNELTLLLRLYGEIIDIFNLRGQSFKQKSEVYKVARENRAFIFMFKKFK